MGPGAPKETILELFSRNSCHPCHRSDFKLMGLLKQASDLS